MPCRLQQWTLQLSVRNEVNVSNVSKWMNIKWPTWWTPFRDSGVGRRCAHLKCVHVEANVGHRIFPYKLGKIIGWSEESSNEHENPLLHDIEWSANWYLLRLNLSKIEMNTWKLSERLHRKHQNASKELSTWSEVWPKLPECQLQWWCPLGNWEQHLPQPSSSFPRMQRKRKAWARSRRNDPSLDGVEPWNRL